MGKYIVVLEEGTCRSVLSPYCNKVGCPEAIDDLVIVDCSQDQYEAIKNLSEVVSIECDSVSEPCSIKYTGNWALPRLNLPESRLNMNSLPYSYNRSGKGVDVYIVDSGIRITHTDFKNVKTLYSVLGDDYDYDSDDILNHHKRHGTTCGSALFGETYGVAHSSNKYSLFTDFMNSTNIKCYDKILANHRTSPNPSVVSLSYSSKHTSSRFAVDRLVREGVIVFAGAGNNSEDFSVVPRYPAGHDLVMSVGALDNRDVIASFSNYGDAIDVWSSGVSCKVAGIDNDHHTTHANGTSLACPYAAGVCALLLEGSEKPTSRSDVEEVRSMYLQYATKLVGDKHVSFSLVNNPTFDSGVTKFIKRFYTIALQREFDTGGLNYWRDELLSKRLSGSDIARGFFNSSEYVSMPDTNETYLRKLYEVLFDRIPSEQEIDYWNNHLLNNNREFILEHFIESPEFISVCTNFGIDV